MSPLFDGLFKRNKNEEKNIFELWRGEERLAYVDFNTKEIRTKNDFKKLDASFILDLNGSCDDQGNLFRPLNYVNIKVGYIDSNGDIWSIAKNLPVGVIKPSPNYGDKAWIGRSILSVFSENDFPFPKNNEYTQRKEALRIKGKTIKSNFDMVNQWLKNNFGKIIIFKKTSIDRDDIFNREVLACRARISLLGSTFEGIGNIHINFSGHDQIIELDEKVTDVNIMGKLRIVRSIQVYELLPVETIRFTFYESKNGNTIGFLEGVRPNDSTRESDWKIKNNKDEDLDVLHYDSQYGWQSKFSTIGSYLESRTVNGITRFGIMTDFEKIIGFINKEGFIYSNRYLISNPNVIGKVEPLTENDNDLARLACGAYLLFKKDL